MTGAFVYMSEDGRLVPMGTVEGGGVEFPEFSDAVEGLTHSMAAYGSTIECTIEPTHRALALLMGPELMLRRRRRQRALARSRRNNAWMKRKGITR